MSLMFVVYMRLGKEMTGKDCARFSSDMGNVKGTNVASKWHNYNCHQILVFASYNVLGDLQTQLKVLACIM